MLLCFEKTSLSVCLVIFLYVWIYEALLGMTWHKSCVHPHPITRDMFLWSYRFVTELEGRSETAQNAAAGEYGPFFTSLHEVFCESTLQHMCACMCVICARMRERMSWDTYTLKLLFWNSFCVSAWEMCVYVHAHVYYWTHTQKRACTKKCVRITHTNAHTKNTYTHV